MSALLVGASPAFGAVPLRADLSDFLVSDCYKFALGVNDGILVWNQRRQPDFAPGNAGWASAMAGATPADYVMKPDARRLESGTANHPGVYLLPEHLTYLTRFGIEALAATVPAWAGRVM